MTFIAGILLILRHLHVWRSKSDAAGNERQQRFFWNQLKRRTLCSASIALLGVVVASFEWSRSPASFSILLFCALILIVMILVLALLDFLMVSQAVRADEEGTVSAAQALVDEYHRQKKKAAQQKADQEDK